MSVMVHGNTGSNNGNWKGDNVGRCALHEWATKYKPKPKLCQECNERTPYDMSNVTGRYLRELSDWEWLCRRCHMKKDGRLDKLIEGNRNKPCLWKTKTMIKICKYCKNEFELLVRKKGKKHCSKECRAKSQSNLMIESHKAGKFKNTERTRDIKTGRFVNDKTRSIE